MHTVNRNKKFFDIVISNEQFSRNQRYIYHEPDSSVPGTEDIAAKKMVRQNAAPCCTYIFSGASCFSRP
ncbi:hypothetical protein HNQ91_002284 [Filimonas zeae]|nr:hypothetical protein [Filimonas zeae]